jgi:hypothetical protein
MIFILFERLESNYFTDLFYKGGSRIFCGFKEFESDEIGMFLYEAANPEEVLGIDDQDL